MLSLARQLGRVLLDFVLPPHCLVCRQYLEFAEELLCAKCWGQIRVQRPARCPRCSSPEPGERCANCASWEVERALVLGEYAGPLRQAIHLLKFQGHRHLGAPLGRCLGQRPELAEALGEVDLLVPVPLFPARQRERGYNQSLGIAQGLAGVLGVPLCADRLQRQRSTRQQASLHAVERHHNLEGAFRVRGALPAHTCIGLVDDVATTASTLAAGARALEAAGARRVWGVVLACPFVRQGSEIAALP